MAAYWQWDQLLQSRWGVAALAGGSGVVAIGAAAAWLRFRARPDEAERERQRRVRVNLVGRLTSGEIVDVLDDVPAYGAQAQAKDGAGKLQRIVVYRYTVRGVQYEASQEIAPLLSLIRPKGCLPGLPAEVKFDPANPGNSIVICETWSGLR